MNEVYKKFGEASELAQLLEHELGTLLIRILDVTPKFVTTQPEMAWMLLDDVYTPALRRFIRQQKGQHQEEQVMQALNEAFKALHGLHHGFFRTYHGCSETEMLEALETVVMSLWQGYRSVMLLSGVDVDELVNT
ncbi:conserved hypothetical protein [Vibrio crassostreae]|nr:hypothetical protein [Vibrio crassostreae]TCN05596.1 hypothetical protein EDB35_11694 [Vibrio crassostreae]TCU02388.1 hypothetical protein EDB32_13233 [Vibrio crassostreae]CAK1768910.1 conserved hypothetical protein [Vibrio crassostreae]CAK1771501.1 conserved hypothetical protein [Vibrio crassostreae]CAK1787382.1 conserved hypothetical protein [Vibrio crassostreae]